MKFLKSLLIVFTLFMFISCTTQDGETITNEKTAFSADYLSKSKEFTIIINNLNSLPVENESEHEFEIEDIYISFNKKVTEETNVLELNENELFIIFNNYFDTNQNKFSSLDRCIFFAYGTYHIAVLHCRESSSHVRCCIRTAYAEYINARRDCVCPQCGSSGVPGCSGN